jgi:hypothetical protein
LCKKDNVSCTKRLFDNLSYVGRVIANGIYYCLLVHIDNLINDVKNQKI